MSVIRGLKNKIFTSSVNGECSNSVLKKKEKCGTHKVEDEGNNK